MDRQRGDTPRPNRIGRYLVDDLVRATAAGRIVLARLPEAGRAVYVEEVRWPAGLTPEDWLRRTGALARDCERAAVAAARDCRIVPPCDWGPLEGNGFFVAYDRAGLDGFLPVPDDPRALPWGEWVRLATDIGQAIGALQTAGVEAPPFHPGSFFCSPAGDLRWMPPTGEGERRRDRAWVTLCLASWLYASLTPEAWGQLLRHLEAGHSPAPIWAVRPDLPHGMAAVLVRALTPTPGQEFTSPGEFAEALRPWITAASVSTPTLMMASAAEPQEPEPADQAWIGWAVAGVWSGIAAGWLLAKLLPR